MYGFSFFLLHKEKCVKFISLFDEKLTKAEREEHDGNEQI